MKTPYRLQKKVECVEPTLLSWHSLPVSRYLGAAGFKVRARVKARVSVRVSVRVRVEVMVRFEVMVRGHGSMYIRLPVGELARRHSNHIVLI